MDVKSGITAAKLLVNYGIAALATQNAKPSVRQAGRQPFDKRKVETKLIIFQPSGSVDSYSLESLSVLNRKSFSEN